MVAEQVPRKYPWEQGLSVKLVTGHSCKEHQILGILLIFCTMVPDL